MDFLHNNLNKRKQEHSRALMIDFATNLMSMISNGKGGRYSFATNNATASGKRYNEAKRQFLQAQRDYNARRASAAFKDMLPNVKGVERDCSIYGSGDYNRTPLLKPVTLKAGLVKQEKTQPVSLYGLGKYNI